MAKYTSISETSESIINMLRAGFQEGNLLLPENIGLCNPSERDNFIVGIHPYDIKENGEMRITTLIPMLDGNFKNPPTSINMNIMISVVSKAEPTVRSFDEQKILGKVIQLLSDYPKIPIEFMPKTLSIANEHISIEMISMDLDEKVKIWSMFSQPYRLCCFYNVGPILIESNIIRKPAPRVKSVHLGSEQVVDR